MPLQNISKIFQTIKKSLSAQELSLEIYSGSVQINEQNKSCSSCMWHSYLTYYMSHQNIKLSQAVCELWPAQDSCVREDKYITKSEKCLACMRHAYWSLSMTLSNIIKIFQTIKKIWSAHEFGLEIDIGEIVRKQNKARVVLLACDTPS